MKAKEQLLQVLFDYGKSKKWLGRKLRRAGHNVNIYELLRDTRKTIDADVFTTALQIFKDHNFIANGGERCTAVARAVIQLDSAVGASIDVLNQTVADIIADDIVTADERTMLSNVIDNVENKIKVAIANTRKIL